MCGIVGYLDKSGSSGSSVGATLLRMLGSLARRGPDSAGVAVWGEAVDGLIVRVALGEPSPARVRDLVRRARRLGHVRKSLAQASLLRLDVATTDAARLAAELERDADVEVVSIGRRLEIVKEVGNPGNLDDAFGVSKIAGSHGIGHTRLSTESRVDLSHSQPFWAHGVPDLAVVHNGHITNYHRLRRIYEQAGVRFFTENDSEVIGLYLARQLARGLSFRGALEASVRDLDGSFSYLAALGDTLGFAKDAHCLKPLLVAETTQVVAIANEEIALHAALGDGYRAREADARQVLTWEIPRSREVRAVRRRRVA